MKTLANCSLSEFLKQINKIRHSAEGFFNKCVSPILLKNAKKEGEDETKIDVNEKGKKIISEILDVCLEQETEKTIEIIGLCCFMTKEQAEKELTPADIVEIALDLISSQRVVDFFTKILKSVQINTAIS